MSNSNLIRPKTKFHGIFVDNMKLNNKFEHIRQSPTVAIADRVRALKASWRNIIPLHVGDPDSPTPPGVLDAAINAMRAGLTHYGPSRGYRDLRLAIASKRAFSFIK